MKKTQVAALLVGAALGLAGVTLTVVLSRKEGREAASRLMGQTGIAAEQARRVGGVAVKTAVEQYQAQAPKAAEALSALGVTLAQAPQMANAMAAKFPRVPLNGKREPVEVNA